MKTLLLSFLFFISVNCIAQSTLPTWQYEHVLTTGPSNNAFGIKSKSHPLGNVVVSKLDNQIVSYLVDSNGNSIWSNTYYYPGGSLKFIDMDVEESTGDIYVLISIIDPGVLLGYGLLKYSQNGTLLTTMIHDHHPNSAYSNELDEPYDLVLDAEGNVFVLYRHNHGACQTSESGFVINKFNSSLILLWTYYDQHSSVSPGSFCFNSTGTLVTSYSTAGVPRFAFINPATGTLISESIYSIPNGFQTTQPFKLFSDSNGNIFGYGKQFFETQSGAVTCGVVKIDNSGQVLWTDTLGMYTVPKDMRIDGNDDVYVIYDKKSSNTAAEGYGVIAKISNNGTKEWRRKIDNSSDFTPAMGVEVTNSNDVLFATFHLEDGDSYLRKYDESGNVLWESQSCYIAPMTKASGGVSLDPNGGIYLSGKTGTGMDDVALFTVFYSNDVTGIEESIDDLSTFISPNPFEESFNIQFTGEEKFPIQMELYDAMGRKIYAQQLEENDSKIILDQIIPGGTYFVKISNHEFALTEKIIKTK